MQKLIRIPRNIYFPCCEALATCGFGMEYKDWDAAIVMDMRLDCLDIYHLGIYETEDGKRVLDQANRRVEGQWPNLDCHVYPVFGKVDIPVPKIPLPIIIPNPQS